MLRFLCSSQVAERLVSVAFLAGEQDLGLGGGCVLLALARQFGGLVLDRFPDRGFAFDEFGPLGIRPTAGSCWTKQGKPNRLPATYHRTHGVTHFHGCYFVGDDRLWRVNRRRKGTTNTWSR